MLPKGQRRKTVKHDYRIARDAARAAGLEEGINPEHVIAPEQEIPVAERVIPQLDEEDLEAEDGVRGFAADAAANGMRLDAYLAKAIPDISRSRIQLLADNGQISVNGQKAKSSLKLKGGDQISIEGEPRPEPLRAFAEDIPLTVVYEDKDIAVIDKPAGMMVHAGAGATDDARNRGTLVNALLGHFGKLSGVGGEERPGIVHRLDKMTSGLIVVAKNDAMHRKLAQLFVDRKLDKTYLALVQGWLRKDAVTLDLPVARDLVHRTRMTTLRRVGLSENKAIYLRDLARHFTSGELDPREWPSLDDETLIARLVDVKGIGRWTAEMFLIFHELRPDVFPVDDIGLQKAVALHYRDGARMPVAELRAFGERWAPYRSVATWYLWRSLDPIAVEY